MSGLKVVTLNNCENVTCLDALSLLDVQRLNATGDFCADQHLIGVNGADQLQVAGSASRKQIPDKRAQREQAQDHEDSISCVHWFSQRFGDRPVTQAWAYRRARALQVRRRGVDR